MTASLVLAIAVASATPDSYDRTERAFLESLRQTNLRAEASFLRLNRPKFAPTAVYLALLAVEVYDGKLAKRGDCPCHPTERELFEMYSEAEAVAEEASGWAGYEIPSALAWVVAQKERHHHNICNHCRPSAPASNRSAGFFGMGAPMVSRFAPRCGINSVPKIEAYRTRDEWTRAVCNWTVAHPREQVRILFCAWAFYLRRYRGNVYSVAAVWRDGEPPIGNDYAHDIARIWRSYWLPMWPFNGRLPKLR